MTENAASEEADKPVIPEQKKEASPASSNLSGRHIPAIALRLDDKFQDTVFVLDDTFYRARSAKAVHWSIAWSDLMMTMFVLFLAMYAYQAAHERSAREEFLGKKTPEVLAGSTTNAPTVKSPGDSASLVIRPINKDLPLMTAGTIKKVETVTGKAMTPEEEKRISRVDVLDKPVIPDTPKTKAPVPLDAIYDLSQQALTKNNLKKFASIDLVPDTTMRIILTGDLLFKTGKADLSPTARQALQKVANAIKETPYMINVVGHTDDLPMKSAGFKTNWELSVARASRVARFLIEETGMNPGQFEVSGYASFRPLKPNTSEENRAINRRVEIIISKKLPAAEPATPESLKSL